MDSETCLQGKQEQKFLGGLGVEFYSVMKIATESRSPEKGLSLPKLILSHAKIHILENSGQFRALKYEGRKDCLASVSLKGSLISSGDNRRVPAMAFVLVGLPKGDARSGSQLPATAGRTRVAATSFPSSSLASCRSQEGKVGRVSPILRLSAKREAGEPEGEDRRSRKRREARSQRVKAWEGGRPETWGAHSAGGEGGGPRILAEAGAAGQPDAE